MHRIARSSRSALAAGRIGRVLIAPLAICLSVSCIGSSAPQETAPLFNFHVLDPGRAYRSAQPDPEGLRTAIENLGLRTVLNLRGENPGVDWYDAEKAVCEEMGVTLISYPMSMQELPSAEMLGQILKTLHATEYPMLIHCQLGADRTGAISAIYRIAILGDDKATAAAEELTPLKLHLRITAPCMDTLVAMFEPTAQWLADYASVVDQTVCVP